MSIDPGKLCQLEIHVKDLERSLTFYREVLGWNDVPAEIHLYHILEVPEDCPWGVALIPDSSAENRGSNLVPYFAATDPERICGKAIEHGGKKIFGPRKMGAYGETWQIADPDGQKYGLYKKASIKIYKNQNRSISWTKFKKQVLK